MRMVLLRVGIDSGSGGIQGPIFKDGSFEFICIPDNKRVDRRTYGNTLGARGKALVEYFPAKHRATIGSQPMHVDPEFETFTYGDPTSLKSGLRNLAVGDLLVFYAGLTGFDCPSPPALYLVGYFEVIRAGKASSYSREVLKREFRYNFHVRHPSVFALQEPDLVLVKGGQGSRMLIKKACQISAVGRDRSGKPLKILSPKMRLIFGDFNGHTSIQRSPPRWVDSGSVAKAARFVRSLQ